MTDDAPEIPCRIRSFSGRVAEVAIGPSDWCHPGALDKIDSAFQVFRSLGVAPAQVRFSPHTYPHLRQVAAAYIEQNVGRLWGAELLADIDVPPGMLLVEARQ